MSKKLKKFLNKSKKNNNDRTQYRQKNHHEAIVSREVFNLHFAEERSAVYCNYAMCCRTSNVL